MADAQASEIPSYESLSQAPFILGERIAQGQLAVYRAKKRHGAEDDCEYAQKTVELPDDDTLTAVRAAFLEEVKILRQAQHHHVVELVAAYEVQSHQPQLAIVMKMADENLRQFTMGKRRIDNIRQWFHCLACVVDHIHGVGIRHRDIKPENILVKQGQVLLADFGISTMGLVKTLSTTVPNWARARTSAYCAPEVDFGSSRGRSADIFSLGLVFLEMLLAHSYPQKRRDLEKVVQIQQKNSGSVFEKSYAKKLSDVKKWMGDFELTTNQDQKDWQSTMFTMCRDMLQEEGFRRPKAFEILRQLQRVLGVQEAGSTACGCATVMEDGGPALVQACKTDDGFDRVKSLVKNGANPATKGALHQASAHGCSRIVELLLDHHVDVNLVDHSAQTALHCAAGNLRKRVVDFLLQRGAVDVHKDVQGRLALHYASGSGAEDIVGMLLNRGKALVIAQDEDYQTPLHFAAKRGWFGVAKILLDRASEEGRKGFADKQDKLERTALHFAAGCGHLDLVRKLVELGCEIDKKDFRGYTPLHFAASGRFDGGNYVQVVEFLLEKKANPTDLAEKGDNPYSLADGEVQQVLAHAIVERVIKKAKSKAQGYPTVPEDCERMVKGGRSLTVRFHHDLASFLTMAQYHKINTWSLPWDSRLTDLGKGATGDVRQSIIDLESQFAYKRFTLHRPHATRESREPLESCTSVMFSGTATVYQALVSELVILSQPDIKQHPYIVEIHGIAFDTEVDGLSFDVWPILVLGKAQHGNLIAYMTSGNGRSASLVDRLKLCGQIGSAISAMHSNNIVHGDIKPHNVLMYGNGDIAYPKVTDFSYSSLGCSENDTISVPSTRPWCAPEFRKGSFQITEAKLMDVYSFGMVCFWLLFPSAFTVATDGSGWKDFEKEGMKAALREEALERSLRSSIAAFFESSLCRDPTKRRTDWEAMINLLGETIWRPRDGESWTDGSRRLTISDYGATASDVENPEKLKELTLKILSSIYMTDEEEALIRPLLDSTRFTAVQRSEWYLNKILEGLSIHPLISPEKERRIRTELTHGCVNISRDVYQMTMLDYRVRVCITQSLLQRASGKCQECVSSAAFEMATCYKLGLGVPSNSMEVKKWLSQSGRTSGELEERISQIKDRTLPETEIIVGSGSRFLILWFAGVYMRYGAEHLAEAESHLTQEVYDMEMQLGKGHWLTFQLHVEVINLLGAQGKYDKAISKAEDLQNFTLKQHGTTHIFYARASFLLADLYVQQHRLREAEDLFLSAKEILLAKVGKENQISMVACFSLASIYLERGKMDKAEEEYAHLFRVMCKTLPANHELSILVAMKYSELLESRGNISEAGEVRRWHNSTNTDFKVLFDKHNRGRDLRLQGNPVDGEVILREVKSEAEALIDRPGRLDAKELLRTSMKATRNLALAIRDQDRLSEAEELQRALRIQIEAELGQSHLETLSVLFDLSRTLQLQQKWREAETLQLIVRSEREKLLGRINEETGWSSRRLAEIYEGQGRLKDAEAEMKTYREICFQRLGQNHSETMRATRDLILLYLKNKDYNLAIEELLPTLSLHQSQLGPFDVETLGLKCNLGFACLAQHNVSAALNVLQPTVTEMRQHLGPEHHYTKNAESLLSMAWGTLGI